MNDRIYRENKIRTMLLKVVPDADAAAPERLNRYYELLIERNQVMNLTAITEFDDVVEKHFADSLLIVQAADLNRISSVMDVGSGAGFPGLPLKIVFPALKVTLLDSLNKRTVFLTDVIRELGLNDVTAVHIRAEDAGKDSLFREKYDLCVSRAVADLCVLSELCLPFVKCGGVFVSYKAAGAADEIASAVSAISLLGGSDPQIKTVMLPKSRQNRLLVCTRKEKETPSEYPRRAGIPMKRPLKKNI